MPRLAADPNPWHFSAALVCVGQSEHPGRFEWELRSGAAWAAIDFGAPVAYPAPEPKERTREAGLAQRPHLLPSFAKEQSHRSRWRQAHNLGTTDDFGASAPVTSPTKNWSLDSHRGSRLQFEWRVSGFTVVCFWTAPVAGPQPRKDNPGAGRPREAQVRPGLHTGPIESE